MSDSYDLHRRLRGLASFPSYLPGRATNRRRVHSILNSLSTGSASYSHLTCCLPYPDFHQILNTYPSPKTEPMHRVRCLFQSFTATNRACIGAGRCFMQHNIGLHIARHAGCTSCGLPTRFPCISIQTLRGPIADWKLAVVAVCVVETVKDRLYRRLAYAILRIFHCSVSTFTAPCAAAM